MAAGEGKRRIVRVEVTFGSVVLFLGALALAFVLAQITVSARRILSWVVASAVAAALIELAVQLLDRYMKRALAIVLVLLAIGLCAGVLMFGVFQDLDREVNRLKDVAPVAALRIEHSDNFGGAATQIQLEERVRTALDRLNSPSSGLAGQAVSSVGTYTVCVILMILFLSWGPRVARATLGEINPIRAEWVKAVAESAFTRARRYVLLALAQAAIVGLIGYAACQWADIPAPAPLALTLAGMALLPNIGIVFGAAPILLLSGGFGTTSQTTTLTILFLGLQVLSSLVVQRRIDRLSNLHVGPAVIAISSLAGFELYGIGGAVYAASLSVLAVAAIDANAEVSGDEPSESERLVSETD